MNGIEMKLMTFHDPRDHTKNNVFCNDNFHSFDKIYILYFDN